MKRSPWFNARRQPPVNGGPDAVYEHRCLSQYTSWRRPAKMRAKTIRSGLCDRCQWRGLLREGKK